MWNTMYRKVSALTASSSFCWQGRCACTGAWTCGVCRGPEPQQPSVSHTGRTPYAVQGYTRIPLRGTVSQQGLWEAGFAVLTGWDAPGLHRVGWTWLACLNDSTGWPGATAHDSGACGTLPGPHDEEGYLSRGRYPQEQIKALLISWDVKATHDIEP